MSLSKAKTEKLRQKLKTKVHRRQCQSEQPQRTIDLDVEQSVGECMFGRLRTGENVLVLMNRACMDRDELAATRLSVGCNLVDRDAVNEAYEVAHEENISQTFGKDKYKGSGLKIYPRGSCRPIFSTPEELEQFYQEYDYLENELSGVMPEAGGHLVSVDACNLALSCFSPYFPDSLTMSNKQPLVGSALGKQPGEEDDDNPVTRRRLLSDRIWLTNHTLEQAFFDRRQVALALYEKQPRLVKQIGMIRVHDRTILTDQITSILIKHPAVKEVHYTQHAKCPWILTSLSLVVDDERWGEFMAMRKALESRWLIWYLRTRCGYRVDLYSGEGVLVAKYDRTTDLREDLGPVLQPLLEDDHSAPLVRVNECGTTGCYLREDHIAEDAGKILKVALD